MADLLYHLKYDLSTGEMPRTEWENYLSWAQDFEYDKLGLPRPDLVLFLDMPVEVSQALLLGRYHGDEEKKDIHESDLAFLRDCAQTARFAAQRLHWHVIPCSENGVPLEREKSISQCFPSWKNCSDSGQYYEMERKKKYGLCIFGGRF